MIVNSRDWQSYIGKRVIVFDSLAWAEAGYDQPDGNEQFYRPATIEAVRFIRDRDDDLTADVRWDHNGRRTVGHFVSAMREMD